MTTPAPDQLAELRDYMVEKAIDTFLASRQTAWADLAITPRQWASGLVDGCMSRVEAVVAAEVEARVQAAANQRAAEELRAAADVIDLGPRFLGETTPAQVNRNRAEFITAATLAPVPPDANGGEER